LDTRYPASCNKNCIPGFSPRKTNKPHFDYHVYTVNKVYRSGALPEKYEFKGTFRADGELVGQKGILPEKYPAALNAGMDTIERRQK
jgi:hypothetical protein